MKRHHALLIALGTGALFGVLLNPFLAHPAMQNILAYVLDPIGQIFLRLVFMIVVPMVFAGLVLGACQLGSGHGLGKVAMKTLMYTIIASSASVVIGVGLVNLIQPGKNFQIPQELLAQQSVQVEKVKSNAAASKNVMQALVEIIPKNPLDAAVRALDGEMLSLMFFALMMGVALSFFYRKSKSKEQHLKNLLEEIFEASLLIVDWAMKLAPLAVFALVFSTTLKFGYQILFALALYVFTVLLGLALQQFGVYTFLLKTFTKRKPMQFFSKCREVYLCAFATASSNATLPRTLETAERDLGIKPSVARFVLTVGSTANQNGTALFEGITVLFLAQVFGIQLGVAEQAQVVFMSILAGIGTAGVPGGSLPLIMILLLQLRIPAEGMALVLGVDRFLDMCRTTVNVSGDLVIAALVNEEKGVSA